MREIDEALEEGERILCEGRQSGRGDRSVLGAAAGLVLAAALATVSLVEQRRTAAVLGNETVVIGLFEVPARWLVEMALLGFVLGIVGFAFFYARHRRFAVTDRRVLVSEGIFRRTVSSHRRTGREAATIEGSRVRISGVRPGPVELAGIASDRQAAIVAALTTIGEESNPDRR